MNQDNLELLIDEVEKRPALYNRDMKEYSNTTARKHLWDEVYSVVIPHWSEMEAQTRLNKELVIQRKWQSLRNCFARELRNQRKEGPNGKRRKYIYFDKLSFLLHSIEHRDIDTTEDNHEAVSEDEHTYSKEYESSSTWATSHPQQTSYEEPVIKIVEAKTVATPTTTTTETDEDTYFALSIVPMLKSLDGYKKMDAKIQILTLLKSIKFSDTIDNPQQHSPATSGNPKVHAPSVKQMKFRKRFVIKKSCSPKK